MTPRPVRTWLAVAAAAAVSATCGDTTAPVPAARLDVVPATVRIGVGQSIQLTVTARDDAGAAVPGVSLA